MPNNEPDLKMDTYAHWITEWRKIKNFPMPEFDDAERMLGKVALIVEEVGESMSAVRKGDIANFREEMADAVIRIMDLCAANGISLEAEIKAKMAINWERPERHGKRA